LTKDELAAALRHPNIAAFLRAIRLGEGTSDEDGYRRIVGGELFSAPPWRHPEKRVWIPRYHLYSTAAGAYQMLSRTWAEMAVEYDLSDFSPQSQDLAAVGLIVRRGALDDLISGDVGEAIRKCKYEWASLPGAPYGQRTESMANVLIEYLSWGGELA
jgi:muramidase (phage lysozyme)